VLETEQQGVADRVWWAGNVGYVRQGVEPQVVELVEYGPR
jgi:hypothetical protein